MTVGVLIISHSNVGSALLRTAHDTLGACPLHAEVLSVPLHSKVEDVDVMAEVMCMRLNTGDGVLVMTDLYGSTPSNIANRLQAMGEVEVVAGINLPMLLRVMNYFELPLLDLVDKAVSGGYDGIFHCQLERVLRTQD